LINRGFIHDANQKDSIGSLEQAIHDGLTVIQRTLGDGGFDGIVASDIM
jgi:hypothetical protein